LSQKNNFINVRISLEKEHDMSLFLGHIHFLMYNKILFSEEIFENLLNLFKDNNTTKYKKILNEEYPVEKGNLTDLIDENNIHGWLDERVNRSENKIAKLVSILLEKGINIDDIKNVYYNLGLNEEKIEAPEDAFNIMTSKFLDGMPCDGAIIPVENTENTFTFKINRDVHSEIWSKYINSEIYWTLRNEFVKGILDDTKYKLKRKGDIYKIEG